MVNGAKLLIWIGVMKRWIQKKDNTNKKFIWFISEGRCVESLISDIYLAQRLFVFGFLCGRWRSREGGVKKRPRDFSRVRERNWEKEGGVEISDEVEEGRVEVWKGGK